MRGAAPPACQQKILSMRTGSPLKRRILAPRKVFRRTPARSTIVARDTIVPSHPKNLAAAGPVSGPGPQPARPSFLGRAAAGPPAGPRPLDKAAGRPKATGGPLGGCPHGRATSRDQKGDTRDLIPLRAKTGIYSYPAKLLHPDLWGLVGTLFGSISDENRRGVAVFKNGRFFMVKGADFFGRFSPNLDL